MVLQHGPAAAVQHTASALEDDLMRSGSFVTLFHAQLDIHTGELRYVDAGHGQVFLRRQNGALESLTPYGLPIGVAANERYREGKITIAEGDLLLVYSDGLTEARPDLFREQANFAAQIAAKEPAAVTTERLVELATSNGPLPDDLTVVAVKRVAAA
jgi:serine phosphatase RsbU (regulator of sigma subunit)